MAPSQDDQDGKPESSFPLLDKDDKQSTVTESVKFSENTVVIPVPCIKKKTPRKNETLVTPGKEEKHSNFYLKIIVVLLFFIIVIGLAVILVFHNRSDAVEVESLITFSKDTRKLEIKSIEGSLKLLGRLGTNLLSEEKLHYCARYSLNNKNDICYETKSKIDLNIKYKEFDDINCYNISWTIPRPRSVTDCFHLKNAHWYGMTVQPVQKWPISEVNIPSLNFSPGSGSKLGLISSPYWLSSQGISIVVPDADPFQISWNKSGNHFLCFTSQPAGRTNSSHSNLNYFLCKGKNVKNTHIATQEKFFPSSEALKNEKLLDDITWSLQKYNKTFQMAFENLSHFLASNNLSLKFIELNQNWQNSDGDLSLDPLQFPNISEFISSLSEHNTQLVLPVGPYFHYNSVHFSNAIKNGYFIKDSSGTVTGLVKLNRKEIAVLDVSNPRAASWFQSQLGILQNITHFSALRMLPVGSSSIPWQANFYVKDFTIQMYIEKLVTVFTSITPNVFVDSAANSQRMPLVVNIVPKIVQRNDLMCIDNVIPAVLSASLLGYPYVTVNALDLTAVSTEIYLKYLGLVSFLPVVKIAISPRFYTTEVAAIIKKLNANRQKLRHITIAKSFSKQKHGYLTVQPLWWLDPQDSRAQTVNDQFVIDDKILVAPILCDRHKSRNIYLPKGKWHDPFLSLRIEGGRWLWNYSVKIGQVPYFVLSSQSE